MSGSVPGPALYANVQTAYASFVGKPCKSVLRPMHVIESESLEQGTYNRNDQRGFDGGEDDDLEHLKAHLRVQVLSESA